LRLGAAVRPDECIGVVLTTQRMIDGREIWRTAADDRPVALFHHAGRELPAEGAGHFGVEGEEWDYGCPAIETVGRPDPPPDLVAQDLDGETRFVVVDFGTVDQQRRRLVDDDYVLVAKRDRQPFRRRNAAWLRRECPCR
jgi:hypothetical protein